MPRLLAIAALLLPLTACASGRTYATGRVFPTVEVDDVRDGFIGSGGREGERPDPFRAGAGIEREYDSGHRLYMEVSRQNRHVMQVEVGGRIPLGR